MDKAATVTNDDAPSAPCEKGVLTWSGGSCGRTKALAHGLTSDSCGRTKAKALAHGLASGSRTAVGPIQSERQQAASNPGGSGDGGSQPHPHSNDWPCELREKRQHHCASHAACEKKVAVDSAAMREGRAGLSLREHQQKASVAREEQPAVMGCGCGRGAEATVGNKERARPV
ncbi:hypothetical protein N9L68_07895 [bacterium]|nr:hypothetical protein [bacterium]